MIVDNLDPRSENRHSYEAAAITSHRRAKAKLLLLAPALLSLGFAGGCGAARPIKYYQLTVPGDIAPSNAQALPVTVIVHLPAASDLYRDSRVVYGVGEQEMGVYEYERWVGPPPEMIQSVLLRQLRASGRYSAVYTPQGKSGGDFALMTRIYDFKEQDSGSTLVGRLTMDIELRNIKTGETVWHTYYAHDEPISAKTVPDVVAALNRNVQLAATNISSGMEQYFTAHPSK